MILFDAHVHIQDNFTLSSFLTSAERNFTTRLQNAWPGKSARFYLLLTEAKKLNNFSQLKEQIVNNGKYLIDGWQITDTGEEESLLAMREGQPEKQVFLVAGRQIVTMEKLEILALATTATIADGLALQETVDAVRKHQGLVVLPWGAGKWLGTRGRLAESFIHSAPPDRLFVGDSGGRPVFWPTPRLFATAAKRGIRMLPGSDPLPLPGEELRVGSYGAAIEGQCTDHRPAKALKTLLADHSLPIQPFGNRQGAFRFFATQLALRLHSGK